MGALILLLSTGTLKKQTIVTATHINGKPQLFKIALYKQKCISKSENWILVWSAFSKSYKKFYLFLSSTISTWLKIYVFVVCISHWKLWANRQTKVFNSHQNPSDSFVICHPSVWQIIKKKIWDKCVSVIGLYCRKYASPDCPDLLPFATNGANGRPGTAGT